MNLSGLSSDRHRNIKFRRITSYDHVESHHTASITTVEIAKAALCYPVLFLQRQGVFHPVVLLGLAANENLYLEGSSWRGVYVPASIRAYPFRLAGEHVLIDESAPHFSNSEGETLFTDTGDPTQALCDALGFLRACNDAENDTQKWCKYLDERDLLVERCLEVISPQGARYRVNGYYVVDQAAISCLPDIEIATLEREGVLSLIHAHLHSLEHLTELAAQRDAIT
ncbi:SapC family protein [Emcibacter nanhaiensis]|uniref:SapC family protein n=1 Tax=Emcibacter nanhaiensis TaxID=1505037 RepID=A0A501PGE5_9PROT|nr:SapC family protein [Emcibacter nanhaiensis]TPD59533.1 SapC family protein [Emcibacter nanhaiensis]